MGNMICFIWYCSNYVDLSEMDWAQMMKSERKEISCVEEKFWKGNSW